MHRTTIGPAYRLAPAVLVALVMPGCGPAGPEDGGGRSTHLGGADGLQRRLTGYGCRRSRVWLQATIHVFGPFRRATRSAACPVGPSRDGKLNRDSRQERRHVPVLVLDPNGRKPGAESKRERWEILHGRIRRGGRA